MKHERLHIGGMTCVNCQNEIVQKLRSTAGVESASVSYGEGIADIVYDPAILSRQDIEGLFAVLGYTVQPGPQSMISEAEAIAAARACFEAKCDTSVFSFDEYTVSLTETAEADGSPSMPVLMRSIYDNGCSFTVMLGAQSGDVLRFSTPRLATVPAFLNSESVEVQAWYDKLGPYTFTWSQENQAEFSRRYEGAALRTARSGELSAADAQTAALKAASDTFAQLGETGAHYAYPTLYAERASADGVARYVVRCYAQPVTQTLPSPCVLVTLRAGDGTVESVQLVEDEAQAAQPVLNAEE